MRLFGARLYAAFYLSPDLDFSCPGTC